MALAVTTAVLAFALLAAAGVAAYRHQRRISALAAMLLAALALVAVDPKLPGATPERLRILVIDASLSFQPAHARLAEALGSAADDLGPRDRIAVVLAGAQPELVLAPSAPEQLAPALAKVRPTLSSVSDLAAGVRAAAALVPKDGSIAEVLLVSDGLETRGSLAAAALALRQRGVRLDCWCPALPVDPRARVVSLTGPSRVSPGDRIALRIHVSCPSEEPVVVRLTALHESGAPLKPRLITVAGPIGERRALVELPAGPSGLLTVTARIDGEARPGDSGRRCSILVSEPGALVAIGISAATRRLLAGQSRAIVELDADRLTQSRLKAALATAPGGIVIEDLSPAALTPIADELGRQVESGRRVIWLTGESGLRFEMGHRGAARLTALVEDPPRDPSRAVWLSLAVDASASMKERYPAAVRAGLAAARELLEKRDRLALTAFARELRYRREPAPTEDLDQELGKLLRLEPRGGTDILTAMNAIVDDFARAADGADRIGVICTDAEVELEPAALAKIEARIASLRIDKSRPARVVFLLIEGAGGRGAEALEPLRVRLDRPGWSGRVVAAAEVADALPKLLRGAVRRSRERFLNGPLAVQTLETGIARGLPARPGLVARALRCRLAEGAESLAEVSEQSAPLLAVRGLGAGEVLTCATDGPALASLAVKPEGASWLAQLFRGRESDSAGWSLNAGESPREWTLSRQSAGPWPTFTAVWRRGEIERPLTVVPVSERRARMDLPVDHSGGRLLVYSAESGAGKPIAVAELVDRLALELSGAEPDLARLARSAALTGGRLLDRPPGRDRDAVAPKGPGASRSSPIPAIVALIALIAWMARESQ